MISITDTMEVIYRDIFDLVNYTSPDPATAPPIRNIERQPHDVSQSFTALTDFLLNEMNDSSHKTVVSEVAGAYWTSVHSTGFNFRAAAGTGTPSGSTSEAVTQGNYERAGMLMSRFNGNTDPQTRYYAAFALAVVWARYWHLAYECGWKTVTVLLYSARFRDFSRAANPTRWEELVNLIKANTMSIQLLGSFHTSWYKAFSEAVSNADSVLTEQERIGYDGHYHNWRVPSDPNGRVAERHNATFEVGDYTKIGNDGRAFIRDPRIERRAFETAQPCGACGQMSRACHCNLENWSPARIELVGTVGRGTGVRALQVSPLFLSIFLFSRESGGGDNHDDSA